MTTCWLSDRTIVHIGGDDAEELLNRLFTRNMLAMSVGDARFAALLSPQGKLLFDFLVYRRANGFWLDVLSRLAPDLIKRLAMYKLRAAVTIQYASDLAVGASWGASHPDEPAQSFRDPRHADLGWRHVAEHRPADASESDAAAYRAHCVRLGIPTGGIDYQYGDSFVHDANLDLLDAVDFDKGCYVGQEVVSRVQHRSSARKRIVGLRFAGAAPATGADLQSGPLQIGIVTSVADDYGLASVRLDRLADAARANAPVTCGQTLAEVILPEGMATLP